MSLEFSRVECGSISDAVTYAVETPSNLVVGYANGKVRVFSSQNHILEREFSVGRTAVSPMMHIPGSETVAIICDRKCSVQNLATRKVEVQLDSRSAKFLSAAPPSSQPASRSFAFLVVGSSYKVRILSFQNSKDIRTTVLDTPDRLKVRCVGNAHGNSVYLVLGNKSPALWHLDLLTTRFRPILALSHTTLSNHSRKFIITGTPDHLIVGCSTGAQLIKLKPLKISRSWEGVRAEGATTVKSQPTGLECICVLLNDNSQSRLALLNPLTGTELAHASNIRPFGDKTELGIHADNHLVRLTATLSVAYITQLTDMSEAASLALRLPANMVNESIRDIERAEGRRLFREGDVADAMGIFLQIEEQEESGSLINHTYVVDIIEPYIDEVAKLKENGESVGSDSPVHSSQHFVFSARTLASSKRSHPLDSIVAYLVFTRRKLRIARHDGDYLDPRVDTALFRSYMIMKSPLVAPLLRSENKCDPTVVKEALLACGKWRELVWFLRSKNKLSLHREALDLMIEHNEPPEAIIGYLERLSPTPGESLDTIFEYARSPISNNHDLAFRLFFEERDIDSSKVYHYLLSISEGLASSFARFRVLEFGDETSELHNVVAVDLTKNPKDTDELLSFLRSSKHITESTLVKNSRFPMESVALLEERLGNYERAITIYIDELGDISSALKLSEKENVMTFMFDKLAGSSLQDSDAAKLSMFLNNASTKSDLSLEHVLSTLPQSFSTLPTSQFLSKYVADMSTNDAWSRCLEALSHTALTELSIQLTDFKQQKVSINASDACEVCHKRLGRAMTVVVNGKLVHYACLKLL